jgi:hypothetical protein
MTPEELLNCLTVQKKDLLVLLEQYVDKDVISIIISYHSALEKRGEIFTIPDALVFPVTVVINSFRHKVDDRFSTSNIASWPPELFKISQYFATKDKNGRYGFDSTDAISDALVCCGDVLSGEMIINEIVIAPTHHYYSWKFTNPKFALKNIQRTIKGKRAMQMFLQR